MSLIAEFTIDSEEFLLGRLIAEIPDLSLEVERVVPADELVMPYIWGHGDALDEFEATLRESPDVESVTLLDRINGEALYKIAWEEPAARLIAGLSALDATILEAHGDGVWWFRIRFEGDNGLASFRTYCEEHGVQYRIERVYQLTERTQTGDDSDLTGPQRDALTLAVEQGYFKVPRETTLRELAAPLDISEQAFSERLRRGADTLFRDVLPVTAEENTDTEPTV